MIIIFKFLCSLFIYIRNDTMTNNEQNESEYYTAKTCINTNLNWIEFFKFICTKLFLHENPTYGSYLFFVFLCIFFVSPTALANQKLTLNSGTAEPFVTPNGGGFYGVLTREIFSRLNIDATVVPLPSGRSLINANRGIDDGVIARTKGVNKIFTNLIRVPSGIVTFKFVAYSLDKKITVTGWDSFKPYSVGIIRGWRIYEKNVQDVKQLISVTGPVQLFKLLLNGRSDLILFEYHRGSWWNHQLSAQAHLIGSPIAEKIMYIFMHKKHTALVPKITVALESMKKDGTFQRLKDKYLSIYQK